MKLLTCGSVEYGRVVVLCECGRVRQFDRPHGFMTVYTKGWNCPGCGVFNGEEKEIISKCRCCEYNRPESV